MDFTQFNFIKGKSYQDCNVYEFRDSENNELRISEKIGKFQEGELSRYLLFEYDEDDKYIKEYIDRKSELYSQYLNIKYVVDNINGDTIQCTGCNSIVLKSQITSGKGDKCVYCDMYICKGCKKLKPLVELNDDRLCEKCREEKK